MAEPIHILLTGGAGFLGKRVVAELRDLARRREDAIRIRTLDLVSGADADETLLGDITERSVLDVACRGMDVVIHSAALIDWGATAREKLFSVNVEGTRNVLEAARAHGVGAVVHTSTMDTVMDGNPLLGIDEDQPYPERYLDGYSETKAAAEQAVLAANGPDLRTCALRPCGMYGEADPYHMDSVMGAARDGKLSFRLGSPDTVFEHVYVGNVAYAHALATFAMLEPTPPAICGKPYFVTDQPADNFFEFMGKFVERRGYAFPPVDKTVPTWAATLLGRVNETLARLVQPVWKVRPALTRSSVSQLVTSISIDTTRLADDLGYAPRYAPEEAFERVSAYYAAF